MKENVIVKKYELIKPIIQNIDSLIDISPRDCHNEYFHPFGHICVYDKKIYKYH